MELQTTHFNPYLNPFYGFLDLLIGPAAKVQPPCKKSITLTNLQAPLLMEVDLAHDPTRPCRRQTQAFVHPRSSLGTQKFYSSTFKEDFGAIPANTKFVVREHIESNLGAMLLDNYRPDELR